MYADVGSGIDTRYLSYVEISTDDQYAAIINSHDWVMLSVENVEKITVTVPKHYVTKAYGDILHYPSEVVVNLNDIPLENQRSFDNKILKSQISINTADKTFEIGDEIIIEGIMQDQFGNAIRDQLIFIKTEPTLDTDDIIAYSFTDENGHYHAKAIVEDWYPKVNLFALYLENRDQLHSGSISLPHTIKVESGNIPIINTAVDPRVTISSESDILRIYSNLADVQYLSKNFREFVSIFPQNQ